MPDFWSMSQFRTVPLTPPPFLSTIIKSILTCSQIQFLIFDISISRLIVEFGVNRIPSVFCVLQTCAQWVETVWDRRVHFIQKTFFPLAREWAKWVSERKSECSGERERSEQSGASEQVSGASEQPNRQASGPVLTSVFFSIFDQSDELDFWEMGQNRTK